jgi:hypothetical protein
MSRLPSIFGQAYGRLTAAGIGTDLCLDQSDCRMARDDGGSSLNALTQGSGNP